MMLRSSTSCFRCQKGGKPAKLTVGGKGREDTEVGVLDKKFLQTFIPHYYILSEGREGGGKREVGWRERERK